VGWRRLADGVEAEYPVDERRWLRIAVTFALFAE